MNMNELVLMVTTSAANFQALRQTVAAGGDHCQVRRAHDVPTALARVAGGGVRAIVLDISGPQDGPGRLDGIGDLHDGVPELPLLIWSDSEVPGLLGIAARMGASGSITRDVHPSELRRILRSAIRTAEPSAPARKEGTKAAVIAVMGAKGGVGATTVALNVAAALTARGSVILAEIRSTFGSLHGHLHPGRLVRGLTNPRSTHAVALEAPLATSVLWPVPSVAGLRVLFGPQTVEDCCEIDPARATAILQQLAGEADFVVVDLPVALSPANRAILGASQYLALVLDPGPACLRLGKLTLDGIQTWDKTPSSAGTVVVKRSAENTSIPVTQIEAELGVPIFKVIPPAPELCALAERTHIPLIQCEPDSLVADSFAALARCFNSQDAVYRRNIA